MKKIAFIIIALCVMSCSDTDRSLANDFLIGEFNEVSPREGASNIITTPESLTHASFGKTIVATFTIRVLSNNRLELSCNECDEAAPHIVSYRIIDQDTFKIGNLFRGGTPTEYTYKRI